MISPASGVYSPFRGIIAQTRLWGVSPVAA